MDAVIIEAVGVAVAFGVAGFCSGASGALRELEENPDLLGGTGEEGGEAAAFSWWKARRRAVSMVLGIGHRLGIVAGVVFAVVLAARVAALGTVELAALVAGMTFVAVIATDVVPVTVARSKPKAFALAALKMLRLPYLLLYPFTRLLLALRGALARFTGSPTGDEEQPRPGRLWKQLVAARDVQTADRRRLLRSVVDFPTTRVREVMIPRTDMVVISRDMELDEIILILLECGHSRIPVHGESLDDIDGLFYAKDVIQLMASGRKFEIDEFLRRPHFVPETKPISELLTEFQKQRIHLAVVVDEFGGTAGLITLEDIIEEFFGDIQDEYDVEPAQLIELSPTTVLADARIGIDDVEEFFDVELPDNDEYDSLGGFLLDQSGAVPSVGDEIKWDSLEFRVVEADAKRIDTVEIEKISTGGTEEPAEMVS